MICVLNDIQLIPQLNNALQQVENLNIRKHAKDKYTNRGKNTNLLSNPKVHFKTMEY